MLAYTYFLSIFAALLSGCFSEELPDSNDHQHFLATLKTHGKLQISTGELISVALAITPQEQEQGLSGKKREDWPMDQGMLFVYDRMGPRHFWMPDTYFDLTIIYLNEKRQVTHIIPRALSHPGYNEPPSIFRAPEQQAQYILELAADSPLALKIKIADYINCPLKLVTPSP